MRIKKNLKKIKKNDKNKEHSEKLQLETQYNKEHSEKLHQEKEYKQKILEEQNNNKKLLKLIESLLLENKYYKRKLDEHICIDNIIVTGYYNTGTDWINNLIIENTPQNKIHSLVNKNKYIDNNCVIKSFNNYRQLEPELLENIHSLIIYMVDTFDDWIKLYNKNSDNKESDQDIYDNFSKINHSNIKLLRKSNSNYIIVHIRDLQKSAGLKLLEILEKELDFEFKKPIKIINNINNNENNITTFNYEINIKFEEEIKKLKKRIEYQFIKSNNKIKKIMLD